MRLIDCKEYFIAKRSGFAATVCEIISIFEKGHQRLTRFFEACKDVSNKMFEQLLQYYVSIRLPGLH